MDHIETLERVNPADAIAAHTRQVERQFVSASWLDPIAGNNAGADAGLRGEHFAFSEHSAIYCYVCKCAERNTTPDIPECVRAMRAIGEPLDKFDDVAEYALYWLIMELGSNTTMAFDSKADAVTALAYRIVRQHTDREEFANASDVIERIVARCRFKNTQSDDGPKTSRSNRFNGCGPVEFRATKSRSSLANPV